MERVDLERFVHTNRQLSIRCLKAAMVVRVTARHGIMNQDVAFLQKPFTAEQLAGTILEVLG